MTVTALTQIMSHSYHYATLYIKQNTNLWELVFAAQLINSANTGILYIYMQICSPKVQFYHFNTCELPQEVRMGVTMKSNDLVFPCQYEKKFWIQHFPTLCIADQTCPEVKWSGSINWYVGLYRRLKFNPPFILAVNRHISNVTIIGWMTFTSNKTIDRDHLLTKGYLHSKLVRSSSNFYLRYCVFKFSDLDIGWPQITF